MSGEDNIKFQGPEQSISNKIPFHKGISEYQATNIQEVQGQEEKKGIVAFGENSIREACEHVCAHTEC